MPSFSKTAIFLALVAYVVAAPWGVSSPSPSPAPAPFCPAGQQEVIFNQDCNFDDISGGLTAAGAPVGTTIPPGECQLFFQGFQSFTSVPGELGVSGTTPGVVPHSKNNYIVTAPQIQMMLGQPMISVNYAGSTTKNFDLNSIYFGCAIGLENSVTAAPVGCTLSIAGFKAPGNSDNEVSEATLACSDSVQYNPTTMAGAQQMAFHTVDPDCKGLQYATFNYVIDPEFAVAGANLLGILDDVDVTTRKCVGGSS